jgi:hypothetical protein
MHYSVRIAHHSGLIGDPAHLKTLRNHWRPLVLFEGGLIASRLMKKRRAAEQP